MNCLLDRIRVPIVFRFFAWAVLLFVGLPAAKLCAQESPTEESKPIFEDFFLDTSDGVKLKCRFFVGGRDKSTVPVLIVHGFGDQSNTYYPLAEALQADENGGCAVILPDLRGHGESTEMIRNDEVIDLSPDRMRRDDVQQIVRRDLVAVKKFLVEKNNAGELNIDMLCVVAVDTGCVYAMNWILRDWTRRQLVGYRRGRDTKAFVLISPKQNHLRKTIREPLRHPVVRGELAAMVVYGTKDAHSAGAARRIQHALQPHHPNKFKNKEDQFRRQDLFIRGLETSLSGGDLVNQDGLRLPSKIAAFIDLRLLSREDKFPWAVREDPLNQ